jgi:hypothetical protein
MSRRIPAVAAGLLSLALAAGCGSSGGGQAHPSSTPPSTASGAVSSPVSPNGSASLSVTPSASATQAAYRNTTDGVSFLLPAGWVVATTPAEAGQRLPAVLGSNPHADDLVGSAQSRLKQSTRMIAYAPAADGVNDNASLDRSPDVGLASPAQVQSTDVQGQLRTMLEGIGAKGFRFAPSTIGGQPAEQVSYTVTPASSRTIYGIQYYIAAKNDTLFVLTVSAGSTQRATSAAAAITRHWAFS